MNKTVRVNVRTVANMAGIRRERRNGRDKIIVPSATLPDGVVMNGIRYEADEIEKGFASLNGTLAPLGHPTINGQFVSASHPEGINLGWIGAHNENVRRENGRVFLDKVIDVQRANESAGGKAVLAAIEKGEPIHTSTGLLCDLEPVNGEGFEFVARNMFFDHDAILLGEEGAATPDQGVGMLVNAKGEITQIEVINSALEDAERELDWAVDHLARALERRERVPMLERIKAAVIEAFTPMRSNTENAEKEDEMSDEKLNALSEQVNAISEAVTKLAEGMPEAIANAVKPLKDHVDQITANEKAKEEAEKADLVAKVVKANVLDEESAKELTVNALRKLADKAAPGTAAALNSAFNGNAKDDEWAGYDLNAGITPAKKEA